MDVTELPGTGLAAPLGTALVPHPVPGQLDHRAGAPATPTTEFDVPSSARVYDYLLGGASHGAVDRRCAAAVLDHEPRAAHMVRASRAFLRRAVRFLLDAGIDQFVDLGSGMPTMGNVHEVVARHGRSARVAYVDRDAAAVLSGRRLLAGRTDTVYVDADIRDAATVLDHPDLRRVVDPTRPVGLVASAVLQQVPDADDPAGLVADYLARLAPGSALALSHLTAEGSDSSREQIGTLTRDYAFSAMHARDRDQVAALLAGLDLVEPGLTFAADWRPEGRRTDLVARGCGHLAAVGFRR